MKSILTILLVMGFLIPNANAQTEPPIGTIIMWGGPSTTIPNGWKPCNGEYLTVTAYPTLSNVLQDYWGPYRQTSSGTVVSFKLPDLRGVFVRGVNGARIDDYKDSEAESRNSTRGISNEVGSFQRDALQMHVHQVGRSSTDKSADSQLSRHRFADFTHENNPSAHNTSGPTSTTAMGGAARVSPETRSKNAYVHYIIRIE